MGGMPFLFWKLIEETKTAGSEKIDLGRTELNNDGLITFKDRLGASRKLLTYCRYTDKPARGGANLFESPKLRHVFRTCQKRSRPGGRVLYRHIG